MSTPEPTDSPSLEDPDKDEFFERMNALPDPHPRPMPWDDDFVKPEPVSVSDDWGIRPVEVEDVPATAKPVTPKAAIKVKSVRTPPTPKVPAEVTHDQNAHMSAITDRVTGLDQHVAIAAHLIIGRAQKREFGKKPHPVSVSLLMTLTGHGKGVCIRGMRVAVEAGLFRRVDKAKGGTNGKASASTYVPTIPRSG